MLPPRDTFPSTLKVETQEYENKDGDVRPLRRSGPEIAGQLTQEWPHDRQPTHESDMGSMEGKGENPHEAAPVPEAEASVEPEQHETPLPKQADIKAEAPQAPSQETKEPPCEDSVSKETIAKDVRPPHDQPKPAGPALLATQIPSIDDSVAARPARHITSLSPAAIDRRLRRVMTPKTNGELKVPERFVTQWKKGGASRKSLEAILASCGYDVDSVFKIDFDPMSALFSIIKQCSCETMNSIPCNPKPCINPI